MPPTPTVASPDFLLNYLDGVKIYELATFDDESPIDYNEYLVRLVDGKLKMTGQGYEGGAGSDNSFREGKGIIFDFIINPADKSPDFEFETYFAVGEWWTKSYRRFGVYIVPSPLADMWIGQKGTGKLLTGNLKVVPGQTYKLMMAIGKDANFLCTIWDPEDPTKFRIYRIPKGGDWSNKVWSFYINGAMGEMLVDNLAYFTFDGYK